jgi:hypothetical protein
METFKAAADRDPIATFLWNAVVELIDSGITAIEAPSPVSKMEGVKYTFLLTRQEKKYFVEVAANRFRWPLSGLIRAAVC